MSRNLLHSHAWKLLFFIWLTLVLPAAFASAEEFDPDSINFSERVYEDYNPHNAFYRMCSWIPIYGHDGKPHRDGHAIQIIADGGNGVQDPPAADGSPGGDDALAEGNFNLQYVNGEKHQAEGTGPGMFVGMMYFVPYKDNQSIYLRIWEGPDPAKAEFYQDSEKYVTFQGDNGGPIVTLRSDWLDDMDWRFGPSKPVEERK